jgi:hypothetical protein
LKDRQIASFRLLTSNLYHRTSPSPKIPETIKKDRHDVIEQPRHDQDEDAGEQGDDRLKVCDANGAYGHFPIPSTYRLQLSATVEIELENIALRSPVEFAMIAASMLK